VFVTNISKNNHRLFPIALLLLLFIGGLVTSCSKDPIRPTTPLPDPPDPNDSTSYADGFFVVNEGNFNWGNASVTFVDGVTKETQQQVFQQINNRPLGDVAQSMKVVGDRAFIIMNNSNSIEVVNLKDFKSIGTIKGFNLPRYMELVDSTKAYVTNLYNDISVVDLNTMSVVKSIQTPEWTESMVKYNQYMFVTCIGSFSEPSSKRKAKVLIIDTKEDRIIDSIQTGKEPLGLVIDKKMKLWVLCSGGFDNYEPPVLIRINPDLREVEQAFPFQTIAEAPSKLNINPSGDTLYFLNNGIYQVPVTAYAIPDAPLIPTEGRLFYGLYVHPIDGTIYATDAVDYVQNGVAYQFSSENGATLQQWSTGRIPGSFCFPDAATPKNYQ
jgi:hypothetical protein